MNKSIDKSLYYLLLISFILIIFGLLLNRMAFGQEYDYGDILSVEEQKLVTEIEAKYLHPEERKVVRFLGDGTVDRNDTIDGDVIIVKGSLAIEGQVRGHVLAFFADLELGKNASINGDVVCVDGKIWRKKGAVVQGDVLEKESNLPKEQTRQKKKNDHVHAFKGWEKNYWRNRYSHDDDDMEGPWVDYNRVYGLTLGWNLPQQHWWEERQKHLGLFGKAGYSFGVKRPQYQVGLQRWIFRENRFTLGGEFHDLCETEDGWIITNLENALAAFFLREDFRDYYRREGFSAFVSQNFGNFLHLQAEYRNDEISNLQNKTNYSVFGGHKKFRPNPGALFDMTDSTSLNLHRNLASWAGRIEFDTRDQRDNPHRGWFIQAEAERGTFDDYDDLKFDRYILDIQRYQPTGWGENLNFRLRAGSAVGVLPPMYWFDLGGLSSLRGYRFKEFTGDRMVLANIEYHFNPSPLDWAFFDEFDLIFFIDSGNAWFANNATADSLGHWPVDSAIRELAETQKIEDDFAILTWSKLKTNVGIGLATHDDGFRVDFARRTDKSGSDIIVTLRLKKSF